MAVGGQTPGAREPPFGDRETIPDRHIIGVAEGAHIGLVAVADFEEGAVQQFVDPLADPRAVEVDAVGGKGVEPLRQRPDFSDQAF